jgi:acyl-coenzyme A synthetase/AMP-(fatty) acid ligase
MSPQPALRNPAGRRKTHRLLNRPRILLDRGLTAANALDKAAAAHPDSVLLHLTAPAGYRGLPADGRLTLRTVLPWINQVGRVLLDAGLARGGRVGIYHTNGPEYFLLGMAVIKAGGVAVPINAGMPPDAVRRHLDAAGCTMLITDPDRFETIGSAAALPGIETWFFPELPAGFDGAGIGLNEAAEAASGELEPAALRPDDPVLLVHTSGTTGRPKLVPSTSGRLVSGARRHYPDEPITRGNRTAVAGHFNHLVCYVGLLSAVLGNLPTWTIGDLRTEKIIEVIQGEKITIFFAFPDIYARIYRDGLPKRAFDSVRIWVSTADACHQAHIQAFCRTGAYLRLGRIPLIPSVFVEAFGASEVGSAALRRIQLRWFRQRSVRSVGRRTLAGPRVRVVDADGRAVAPGQVGRIEVKGATVFDGYWDPEDVQRFDAPVAGWWWTGDLGCRSRTGRISQLDRAVDVIHTVDGPVYSLPVEEVLLTHPGIADAVVIGVEQPAGRHRPVAFVTPLADAELVADQVATWARGRPDIPDSLTEVVVVPFDELPRGLTGKVLRRVLRERCARQATASEQGPVTG